MPTEKCNFKCKYCYETFRKGKMSPAVQDAIINYVKKNIRNHTELAVIWFGGEPLEALDVIERLSLAFINICQLARKPYSASMTTNGYNLTPEVYNKLYDLKVYGYQITLDGYKDQHNSQRISDDKIKQSNSNVVESNYEQYSSVEKEIMEICSKHLGYENINLQDNFFELGADSIILGMIFRDLDEKFTGILQVTDLFSYPTVGLLAEHLTQLLPDKKVYDDSNTDILEINTKEDTDVNNEIADGIAIIGIGINLPNADTLDQYWEMLSNGISTVREMPEERGKDIRKHLLYMGMDKNKIKFRNCGYLDNINMFDYTYFNMSPKEASLIDPVNRMFLECCAKAIDDSGYGKDKIKGSNTGVFLGYTSCVGNAYSRLIYELDPKMFADSLAVSQPSMAASRVAYIYDLKGPSMVLDTACSSAHVAIHMACEQIRSGRCKMALAGGASITQTPFAEGFSVGFESEEYVTRTFSEQSTGSAIAEGVGALLLKDLKEAIKDRDSIYAVIKGTAINQDGSSFGIAAPNYLAQSEVIQEAWQSAGVKAEDICYIEAHGTGTQLGDPIEINGITWTLFLIWKLYVSCI